MRGKWLITLSALVMAVGVTTGGGAVMAKEKHKDIANVSHRGASGYAPEHTLDHMIWEKKCTGIILKSICK